MGTKWFTGGVVAVSRGRIQFEFMFEGVRYRPSIRYPPSEANLRRARARLEQIKRQIEVSRLSFAEEFPDYRFLRGLSGAAAVRTCSDVFDAFLVHCAARFARGDMAAVTLSTYRRVLNGVWRPAIGSRSSTAIASPRCCGPMPLGRRTWSNRTSPPSSAR